ncbi:MAG TPA: helix-turn-helix transcriptional regulator [Oscillatoriales cyanobacterium M59_W2019_021]|nr:MAG: XRE family transcriptional regulator [Cyanobacteria bacterium J055]HIK29896.1 helix-turn-helix transcriptional regulator [Oscillatoriales cyanobacterium M4454_W2019_049]HIK49412.1 helix-turn-helix transcriptional regulator [Oscillatoriales cyanobacterium M59_W2019_021]
MRKKNALMNLLKRRGLTQRRFSELLSERWQPITGRTISLQAVGNWIHGRSVPKLEPIELAITIEVLDCSLTELVLAFEEIRKRSQSKDRIK